MWRRSRGSEALERAQALLKLDADRRRNRHQRTDHKSAGDLESDPSDAAPTPPAEVPSSLSSCGTDPGPGSRFLKKTAPVLEDSWRPTSESVSRASARIERPRVLDPARGDTPVERSQNADGDEEEEAAAEYDSGGSRSESAVATVSASSVPSLSLYEQRSLGSLSPPEDVASPRSPARSPDTSAPREVLFAGEAFPLVRDRASDAASDLTGEEARTAGDGEASFRRDRYESDFESVTPADQVSEHAADEDGRETPSRGTTTEGEDVPSSRAVVRFKDAAAQTDAKAPPTNAEAPPLGGGATPVSTDALRCRLEAVRRFARDGRRERDRAVRGLGPPDYTYATLQRALETIRRAKASDARTWT
ncbi:uncharacterized protein LOC130918876 isoform X2 [Corythoichthys intestinalis]|uniref:uncharacterized protein LOC130918876 isoform X2 n=1 Tax=Corythoichthys intestinalis TaxID=161448 RepID=UPI0025A55D76|nr:uncharacterized protein LOC130918876 isoform X2 [Corythoichthys intestinalis]